MLPQRWWCGNGQCGRAGGNRTAGQVLWHVVTVHLTHIATQWYSQALCVQVPPRDPGWQTGGVSSQLAGIPPRAWHVCHWRYVQIFFHHMQYRARIQGAMAQWRCGTHSTKSALRSGRHTPAVWRRSHFHMMAAAWQWLAATCTSRGLRAWVVRATRCMCAWRPTLRSSQGGKNSETGAVRVYVNYQALPARHRVATRHIRVVQTVHPFVQSILLAKQPPGTCTFARQA